MATCKSTGTGSEPSVPTPITSGIPAALAVPFDATPINAEAASPTIKVLVEVCCTTSYSKSIWISYEKPLCCLRACSFEVSDSLSKILVSTPDWTKRFSSKLPTPKPGFVAFGWSLEASAVVFGDIVVFWV